MNEDTKEGLATSAVAVPVAVVIHRLAKNAGFGDLTAALLAVGIPAGIAALMDGRTGYVLGGSALGALGSAAYDSVAGTTTFLAFSDSHGNSEVRRAVLNAMLGETGVDFVLFVGDAVDDADDWPRMWDADTAALRERWTVYGVPGNHDDAAGFRARFPLGTPAVVPLRRGTLILLGSAAATELRRIKTRIDGAERPIIVAMHQGPIAFSAVNPDADRQIRALAPYLDRIDAVLSGHHHVFGSGTIGNTGIVSLGIAGSKHYGCNPALPEGFECDRSVRGYLRVEVSPARVETILRPVEIP